MTAPSMLICSANAATRSAASGRAAARAASRQFGGQKVLEYHYVHCLDPPGVDEDCWAVSLDPSGPTLNGPALPGQPAPPKPTYLVVLIYPIGHEFVEAAQG